MTMSSSEGSDGIKRTKYKSTKCWVDSHYRVWVKLSPYGKPSWKWIGEVWDLESYSPTSTNFMAIRRCPLGHLVGTNCQSMDAAIDNLYAHHKGRLGK